MKKSEPKMILNISLNSEEIEEKVKIAMDEYAEKVIYKNLDEEITKIVDRRIEKLTSASSWSSDRKIQGVSFEQFVKERTEKTIGDFVEKNIKEILAKKNINDFEKWLGFLESLGYTNYWQDLNAKNYGVAQNRNRCFMFSFLGNYSYDFPQPIPLKKKLKDYLEDNVDEKYYINNEKAEKLIKQLIDNGTLPQHNLDKQTNKQTDLR